MDKRALVEQLASSIRAASAVAQRAGEDAALIARDGATAGEKREDGRVALEFQSLAKGQTRRADRARADLAALEGFRPAPLAAGARITLGAIVESRMATKAAPSFSPPWAPASSSPDPAAMASSRS